MSTTHQPNDCSINLSNNFNYGQVNAGPGAVLTLCTLAMITNYIQMMAINATISIAESKVGQSVSMAGFNAAEQAGQDQASATRAQAYGDFVSAGVTIGALGGAAWANSDLNTQLGKASEQSGWINNTNGDIEMTNFAPNPEETEHADMIQNFANGKNLSEMTAEHVQTMTPAQKTSLKAHLDEQIKSLQGAKNSNDMLWLQTYTQTGQGVARAGAGMKSAAAQVDVGIDNATKSLTDYTQNMAASMQGDTYQQIAKFYDLVMQTVSALRQASQAYPQ